MRLLLGIVLALALVLPPGLYAQAPTAEVPVLRPGDSWSFRWEEFDAQGRRTNGTYNRRVIREDTFEGQRVYMIDRGDGTFRVTSAEDLDSIAVTDAAGNIRSRFTKGMSAKEFPLSVGKTWTFVFESRSGSGIERGNTEYRVVGVEQLATTAGTFEAFRLEFQARGTGADGRQFTSTGYRYYSSAVKYWAVKYSWRTSLGFQRTEELVSYSLQQ